MAKQSKRMELIKAANTIIQCKGAESLTLDAVAHESGVSKGGVLYHFPTKDALLKAMIENWLEEFEESVGKALGKSHTEDGAWLRAFINVSSEKEFLSQNNALALLAAIAHNHDLLSIVRERAMVWQQNIEDSPDPALATLLRLAADGLFWAELLNMAPPTDSLRTSVLNLMRRLAGDQEKS